jgi:DNA modification methylase
MSSILERNTLYRADCLDLLERLPDESIALVYIDPPWNEPSFEPSSVDQEYGQWMRRVLRQYWRVLRLDGNLLVHTKQGADIQIVDLLNETFGRFNAREEIILPTDMKPPNGRRYEYIRRYAKASHNEASLPDSVWDYKAYETVPGFQTDYPERPLGLIETLIEHSASREGIVLDTFCGTGTTLAAAHRMECRWIGCDNDENAIIYSRKRLENQAEITSNSYEFRNSDTLKDFDVVRSSVYPTFFISYARVDSEKYVDPFCESLRQDYIYFWRDKESIPGGANWKNELNQALERCHALILFITPDSLKSKWVRQEYMDFQKSGRPIYPILCEPVEKLPEEIADNYQGVPYNDQERILKDLRQFSPEKDIQNT